MIKKNYWLKSGQSLIELLIVMGLMAVLIPVIASGFSSSREGKAQQNQQLIAASILKETEEAVRNVREKDWESFYAKVDNGEFHPVISGTSWNLEPGSETLTNGFSRSITISSVNRQPTPGNIVPAPTGIIDPSTVLVTITVNWDKPRPSTINSSFYLTRHDNLSYTETTKADFDQGTKSNTETTDYSGGEVQLGAGGGGGDWCKPNLTMTTYDLKKNSPPQNISAIEGRIFTTTGESNAGDPFTNVSVSNDSPPIANEIGYYDDVPRPKAYGVFAEPGNQNYAYIGTNKDGVTIIDLTQQDSNKIYPRIGYFNSGSEAKSIFVSNNIGYAVATNKFYTFDLSSKLGQRPKLGGPFTLAGNGTKVIVNNQYAFVSNSGTTYQLEIFQISSDGKTITRLSQLHLDAGGGVDVSVNENGTRAYVATSYISGKNNLFIVNTENKSNPYVVTGGSYYAQGMDPTGVAVVTGNRVILVGKVSSAKEYQVIKIDNENSPQYCDGLDFNNDLYGVAAVLESDGEAYSYIINSDSSAEIKIILGGGAGAYINQGTFESSTFYNTYNGQIKTTAFNSFKATVAQPPETTIKIKVAVADAINNSCNNVSFSYVGPKGDPTDNNDYYLVTSDPNYIRGLIPLTQIGSYHNPGQCFRYKVWFQSTNPSATPVLYDFIVNYSP